MLAKRGTMALVDLPPGSFELDIFSTVLIRKTIRGPIIGDVAFLAGLTDEQRAALKQKWDALSPES